MNNFQDNFKIYSLAVLLSFILVGLSCDDREASDTLDEEGMTLAILTAQPVADGAAVGEAVVGYAGELLIVELRDADGEPVKNKVISFSSDYSDGDFDNDDPITNSDGIGVVTYSEDGGDGAVDDPTTPLYENVERTAY